MRRYSVIAVFVMGCAVCVTAFVVKSEYPDYHETTRETDMSQAVISKRTNRVEQRWKTGPSAGAWYYIMGHSKPSKRQEEDGGTDIEMSSNEQRGLQLLKEFRIFMMMKERGSLHPCLDTTT